MRITVRRLLPDDAKVYWALRLQALQSHPEAFSTSYEEALARPNAVETAERNLAPSEDDFTLGAIDPSGNLIGNVTLRREQQPKLSHKGNLVGMYVAPDFRGHGVGKALVERLLDEASQIPGLEQIHLAVVSGNTPAVRLYESLGFKQYGTEPRALCYDGKYFDEFLMVCTPKTMR